MRALQKTVALCQAALAKPAFQNQITRCMSKNERDALRAKFQAPGDTPVFLRGGPADKALFGVTVVLIAIGTLHTFYRIYQRAEY